jgi:accessory gene regulator B
MILAIIFNKIIETAIMLIVFAILQVYGGGYHANTKLGCFIIMVIGWFIGIFGISRVISTNYYVSIVIMIISTVLLFVFTPVLNEKHPVGSDVYMRSKKIVRIAVVVIDVLSVLFLVQHWNAIITPLSTVMFLYSVSLFAAIHKLKKRGK